MPELPIKQAWGRVMHEMSFFARAVRAILIDQEARLKSLETKSEASFNGRTEGFEPSDGGSIPPTSATAPKVPVKKGLPTIPSDTK